jgi:hypothetical protein
MDPKSKTHAENETLLEEFKNDLTDTQKVIVNKIIQGRNVFSKYTLKDAVTELEELFDG